MNLKRWLIATFLILIGAAQSPVSAQTDPALQSAVNALLDSYLRTGPGREGLGDGSALANWALLKDVGLPQLRQQPELKLGAWEAVWQPLSKTLAERGFSKLSPMEALDYWQQTEDSPVRFVRLLGKDGLIDPKIPADRKKASDLRDAVGQVRVRLAPLRCRTHYEKSGWSYTGSAEFEPGDRIVRVALRGSKPCPSTGTTKVVNLNLKGRLFADPKSPTGLKAQLLDHQFQSQGCDLKLRGRIDSIVKLSSGDEAKLALSLDLRILDENVTGRVQLDLVSRQVGLALVTGRAIYSVRGRVSEQGALEVTLVPVSSSGHKSVREQLELEGTLSGKLAQGSGAGSLVLPVFKESLNWSATSDATRARKT